MKAGNRQRMVLAMITTLLAIFFTSCSLLDRPEHQPANSTDQPGSSSTQSSNQPAPEQAAIPNVEIAPVAKMNGPWRIITSNHVNFEINAPGAKSAKLLYRPIGVEGRHIELKSFMVQSEPATTDNGQFNAEIDTPADFAGELWAEVNYPDGTTKTTESVPIMTEVSANRTNSTEDVNGVKNEPADDNSVAVPEVEQNIPDKEPENEQATNADKADKKMPTQGPQDGKDDDDVIGGDLDKESDNARDKDRADNETIKPAPYRVEPDSDSKSESTLRRAKFDDEDPNIEIVVNVPAFRLELWQSDRIVKSYPISVGLKEHPVVIDERDAHEIIWNPDWIPPNSKWVYETKMKVRPGEKIEADDPRNPLGKVKIPLGGGYLIHQVITRHDIGRMKSHGCVRMLEADLFDLTDKIVAARDLPVTEGKIRQVKNSSERMATKLNPPLSVDIRYETIEVIDGALHIYPDIYQRGTNTKENLQKVLQSHNINADIDDATFAQIIKKIGLTNEFVIDVKKLRSNKSGNILKTGEINSLTLEKDSTKKNPTKKNSSKPSRNKVIDRSA